MATKKAKKAVKADSIAEDQKTKVFRSIDNLIVSCLDVSIWGKTGLDNASAREMIQKSFDALKNSISAACIDPTVDDWCPTPPQFGPRPIIHWPWHNAVDSLATYTKTKEFATQYPLYVQKAGLNVYTLLENAGWEPVLASNFKKRKVDPLKQLDAKISDKNCIAISKAIVNYIDAIEKSQLAIFKEIEKIIPEGIELKPADFKKPVYPDVDVIIPYPRTPIPDPKIPLDPKIPIPYPKTPLDPKIPIPKPEIKIHGPYVIKDLEIKLAEVERIRKSLPKNATKAEKKAAANAEQQIKNLLKAAKRAEPKATKKAVVKKATKKKSK